ncbi:hypothetical protein [Streptomyces sp. WAC01280]|uniref:hypothetical protein n=1 Tax=Streptomyces sp. WAC01280 TaxID=2487424 RepID=UPI000F7968E0|nr:hypothetical protein [Streptomyces sp. WAC01280]RSS53176.1 hypothetical protein EF909_27095 [Streptomyces sp. WAC01280]
MTRGALTTESTPAMSGALCFRCGQWTDTPEEVGYIERMSGPGVVLYGCPGHARGPEQGA